MKTKKQTPDSRRFSLRASVWMIFLFTFFGTMTVMAQPRIEINVTVNNPDGPDHIYLVTIENNAGSGDAKLQYLVADRLYTHEQVLAGLQNSILAPFIGMLDEETPDNDYHPILQIIRSGNRSEQIDPFASEFDLTDPVTLATALPPYAAMPGNYISHTLSEGNQHIDWEQLDYAKEEWWDEYYDATETEVTVSYVIAQTEETRYEYNGYTIIAIRIIDRLVHNVTIHSITINRRTDDFVGAPPTITTRTLPKGTMGRAYSRTLAATGDAPLLWSLDAGNLPTGLLLDPSTGRISGIPEAAGTFDFTVRASNGTGPDALQALSITILATYDVFLPSVDGGTVTADPAIAAAGETVSLRIAPAAGYELSAFGVRRMDAPTVPVAVSGEGLFRTFVMPDGAVTVVASFQKDADRLSFEEACRRIETFDFTIAQEAIPTREALADWLLETLNRLLDGTGVTVSAGDIGIYKFVPATGGTPALPDGWNGSYGASVSLSKNGNYGTVYALGAITATPYAPPTGIGGASATGWRAYAQAGVLHIVGLPVGQTWSVYSLSGTLVSVGISRGAEVTVPLALPGIYLLVAGGRMEKVGL